MKFTCTTIVLLAFSLSSWGQNGLSQDSVKTKNFYKRKLHFGLFTNMGLSNISNPGHDAVPRSIKSDYGAGIRVEYHPKEWLGISVGFGVQQRGFIYGTPFTKGNVDSLNKALDHQLNNVPNTTDTRKNSHIKVASLDLPILLHLITPREIAKNTRLSCALGLIPSYNFRSNLTLTDVYVIEYNLKNQIARWNMSYYFGLGPEIALKGECILRIHAFCNFDRSNIYSNVSSLSAFSGFSGGSNTQVGLNLNIIY
jgi:hypothetical protein